MACLLAATLLSLAIPWTVQHAIDDLRADAASAPLVRYVAVIVALALANGLARLGSRFAIIGGAQRIEADLRGDLYRSYQAFPPRFYATHPIGDLMTRAGSDVSAVRMLVGFGTVSLAGTTFAFVGALTAMLAVDPWLTLWAMAPYPVLIALAKRFNGILHDRTQGAQEQLGVVSAQVQERLAGMAVVRAYTMEARVAAEFARSNGEYLRRMLALGRVQAWFSPLMGLVAGVGTLAVLWLGGRAVVEGRITLGALVAFNGYLAYLAWPTIALGWTLSIVRRGLTSLGRILEIVTAAGAPSDGDAGGLPPAPAVAAAPVALGFRDLTYAYDERGPVLVDVSFDVGPGEIVAVVGPTGSGKSTLGLLLTRLWEPPRGTIRVGGQDVTRLSLAELRARVAYVPQEAFLFSRSIADNVTLGREAIDESAVRAAARAAGIAEEVERFPEGFATVVGERGLTLSGGQRQRVALARALAGPAPVLVLDDVVASVDTVKEEEIVASLGRLRGRRTIVLMTHRLRAAQLADRVVVLAGGRVVEAGRHEALLAAGGLYARLWRREQLEEEIARA